MYQSTYMKYIREKYFFKYLQSYKWLFFAYTTNTYHANVLISIRFIMIIKKGVIISKNPNFIGVLIISEYTNLCIM